MGKPNFFMIELDEIESASKASPYAIPIYLKTNDDRLDVSEEEKKDY